MPSPRREPDVIVHELTAIAALDMRHFDRDFAMTNRLRTEGTDHLLSAGRAVGVKRFVVQSYTSWPYARTGRSGQDRGRSARPDAGARDARVDGRDPPPRSRRHRCRLDRGDRASLRRVLRSRHVPGSRAASSSRWCASASSRWSATAPACGRSCTSRTRPRRPSRPSSTASAGSTTSSTTIRRRSPSGCRRWRRRSARRSRGAFRASSGACSPARPGVVMMTEIRGASNAKAKRELGWEPRHPSWREGFAA